MAVPLFYVGSRLCMVLTGVTLWSVHQPADTVEGTLFVKCHLLRKDPALVIAA